MSVRPPVRGSISLSIHPSVGSSVTRFVVSSKMENMINKFWRTNMRLVVIAVRCSVVVRCLVVVVVMIIMVVVVIVV